MLRFFHSEEANDEHYTLLMNDLHQTARDLQDAYSNLENVVDPDLIDCCIYRLNSVQMRYKFLLNSIKSIPGETLNRT
ncbi:MAG: YaaL family protein [Lachnospiraceae bacterium]|nr:YaaL family protein [Lachnospiraceae bacterium]